jgi:dipeptidase D
MKVTVEETEMPETIMDEKHKKCLPYRWWPVQMVLSAERQYGRTGGNFFEPCHTEVGCSAGKTIKASCLMRSSVNSAKEELGSRIKAVFELAGAKVSLTGAYPGWKPNMDSPILKTMQDVYNERFGKIPEIKAIHAGLECGILGGSILTGI